MSLGVSSLLSNVGGCFPGNTKVNFYKWIPLFCLFVLLFLIYFYFSISLVFLFSVCCLQQLSMEKLNEHTHIANYEAVLNGYSFNRNQLSMKLMCTHFDDLNSHCPFAPHTSHSFTLVSFYFCRTKYL